jgi:hypothetical protein
MQQMAAIARLSSRQSCSQKASSGRRHDTQSETPCLPCSIQHSVDTKVMIARLLVS